MSMAKLYGYTGATFSASFTCKDSAGAVVNLTGYSARSQMRTSVSSSTVTLDLSPTISAPATGVINITVTDETTDTLEAGTYYWDLVLDKAADGSVTHLADGTLEFRQQVTRV